MADYHRSWRRAWCRATTHQSPNHYTDSLTPSQAEHNMDYHRQLSATHPSHNSSTSQNQSIWHCNWSPTRHFTVLSLDVQSLTDANTQLHSKSAGISCQQCVPSAYSPSKPIWTIIPFLHTRPPSKYLSQSPTVHTTARCLDAWPSGVSPSLWSVATCPRHLKFYLCSLSLWLLFIWLVGGCLLWLCWRNPCRESCREGSCRSVPVPTSLYYIKHHKIIHIIMKNRNLEVTVDGKDPVVREKVVKLLKKYNAALGFVRS